MLLSILTPKFFNSTCISICIRSASCVFTELIVALECEFPLVVLLVLGCLYWVCFLHDNQSETYWFANVWYKGWTLARTIFYQTWSSWIFSPIVPCTVYFWCLSCWYFPSEFVYQNWIHVPHHGAELICVKPAAAQNFASFSLLIWVLLSLISLLPPGKCLGDRRVPNRIWGIQ